MNETMRDRLSEITGSGSFKKKYVELRKKLNSMMVPWESGTKRRKILISWLRAFRSLPDSDIFLQIILFLGHVEVAVRREHILCDSFKLLKTLSPNDLRRIFRFSFVGESGLDAGGTLY